MKSRCLTGPFAPSDPYSPTHLLTCYINPTRNTLMKNTRNTLLAAVLLALCCRAGHAAATFTRLGALPGGFVASGGRGVSADGSVVMGYGNSASGEEAFRWTSGGGMVGLGDLPGGVFWREADDGAGE